jgi:signal transduction histidine kinase
MLGKASVDVYQQVRPRGMPRCWERCRGGMGLRFVDGYIRPGWAAMSAAPRAAVAMAVAAGLLAVAAQITGLVGTGQVVLWADEVAWATAGVAVLAASTAVQMRVKPRTAVWGAWGLYALGAAFWITGTVIRMAVTGASLNAIPAAFWLAFAVCCILSFAVRLPRIRIYGIFLLDSLPVVLLTLAIMRTAAPVPGPVSTVHEVLLNLYPALYVLLAANAIQMAGIHVTLHRVPPAVWLFTPGFAVMALAALLWAPAALRSGTAQGHAAGALWTLGLILIAAAGLTRSLEPTGFTTLPPVELAKGPHALPAATAVLGLIIMLTVVAPSDRLLVLVFLLTAAIDLSVRVIQLRQQDQRLLARLARQNEQLRELDKMKDEFVSLVSHELRTPLTSILGYLELLEDEDAGPLNLRQREFTAVIGRSSNRLLRLVADLLFLARLQSGNLSVEPSEADLPEIARHAVESVRPAADSRDITVTLTSTPVPCLRADPVRLAQLLDNLLSNAIKFTPSEGRVIVTVGTEDGNAALDVRDTGMGIPPAELERVFERFFRTADASARAISGTGLGLTISKAIVDAHGGTISCASEEGKGTTFRVRLPVSRADSSPDHLRRWTACHTSRER